VLTCPIGIIVSVINSIELYLKLQETMENELCTSKEFYNLSTDIHKCLVLNRENRLISGQTFMNDKYSVYVKLQENSDLMLLHFHDKLAQLPRVSPRWIKNKLARGDKSPIPSEVGTYSSEELQISRSATPPQEII